MGSNQTLDPEVGTRLGESLLTRLVSRQTGRPDEQIGVEASALIIGGIGVGIVSAVRRAGIHVAGKNADRSGDAIPRNQPVRRIRHDDGEDGKNLTGKHEARVRLDIVLGGEKLSRAIAAFGNSPRPPVL